jgi:hypothetical protein
MRYNDTISYGSPLVVDKKAIVGDNIVFSSRSVILGRIAGFFSPYTAFSRSRIDSPIVYSKKLPRLIALVLTDKFL